MNEAFRQFFLKNEHGQGYVKQLEELITSNHENAEKNPELARDYTQRAKGVREALAIIQTAVATTPREKRQKKTS